MKAKIKYVLPLIVTFCFLEAAFEMTSDNVKTTWEDAYDIYIPSDTSFWLVLKLEHTTDFALLPHITLFQFDCFETPPLTLTFNQTPYPRPPRLYLAHCSLMI